MSLERDVENAGAFPPPSVPRWATQYYQSTMKLHIPSRSWELPPGVKTLAANGYEMAYLERGQGIPVVLVHGTLNDYRAWASQMDHFSADCGLRDGLRDNVIRAYPEPVNSAEPCNRGKA